MGNLGKMLKYTSLGRHQVKDRGILYSVINEKDRERSNNDLVGEEVRIDGEEFKVKGVEYYTLKKKYLKEP